MTHHLTGGVTGRRWHNQVFVGVGASCSEQRSQVEVKMAAISLRLDLGLVLVD